MIFLDEVPHLKIYRLRTYLPTDRTNKTVGSCILLNTGSIDSDIKLMTHKMFENSKFNAFYMDFMYQGKIRTKTYRENRRAERIGTYEKVRNAIQGRTMRTFQTPTSINKRNVYYDLHVYNELFFSRTEDLEYRKKIKLYLETIKGYFEKDAIANYPMKTMFINVNEWDEDVKKTLGVKNFNNPVFIIYYAMRRMFEDFKAVGNVDIVFVFDNSILKINPSLCDEKSFTIFKQEFRKVKTTIIPENDGEEVIEKGVEVKDDVVNLIATNFMDKYNLVGEEGEDKVSVTSKIAEIVQDELENGTVEDPVAIDSEIKDRLEKDPELMKVLDKVVKTNTTGRTTSSIKRDEELKKRQATMVVNGIKLADVANRNIPALESNNVASALNTSNPNIGSVKYPDFEKSYNQNLYEKDILSIFTDLSDKSLPMYIVDVDIQDTSDELNLKNTWTIKLEDANRQRHTIKVDLPIFIDDKFMYLSGNKKIIIKQQIMKPIVKTNADTVQIVTNYNKMFVRRVGDKVSLIVEQLKKYVANNKITGVTIKNGDNSKINVKFKTSLEYDYLAKSYSEINTKSHRFIFNQENIHAEMVAKKINTNLPKGCWMVIGFTKDNKPIYLTDAQTVQGTELELLEFIIDSMDESQKGVKEAIYDTTAGKRFMYSRAKSMNREVPLILLVSFFQGLTATLRKANIPHYFTDKNPKALLSPRQDTIRFNNGYLVFDRYPIENSLLVHGLSVVNTKAYDYEAFDDRETFLTIFEDMYDSRSLGRYFLNVYESMIDPITKEVLETLGYPTELCDVLVYANNLLADNSFIPEVNMNLYRIRSNEIVASLLYKAIADEYNNYKNVSMVSKNRKMSVRQDAVLKEILTSQIVEDYSTLNPIVELEKSRSVTPKGPSGLNVSRAYTESKRSFDKSMMGIMAISTSPDYNCGVVRSLALEPNIKNARGYIDIKDDRIDELKDVNLFSPGELLTPIGAARDKICHLIPVMVYDKLL